MISFVSWRGLVAEVLAGVCPTTCAPNGTRIAGRTTHADAKASLVSRFMRAWTRGMRAVIVLILGVRRINCRTICASGARPCRLSDRRCTRASASFAAWQAQALKRSELKAALRTRSPHAQRAPLPFQTASVSGEPCVRTPLSLSTSSVEATISLRRNTTVSAPRLSNSMVR